MAWVGSPVDALGQVHRGGPLGREWAEGVIRPTEPAPGS
jgi:hypothetical protein